VISRGRGGPAGRLAQGVAGLQRGLDPILVWTGYLAGFLFLGLAFFVSYDVVARKWGDVLRIPTTQVTDEIAGYLLVLAATWGFAYTLKTDAHVRIDVLLPHMAPPLRATMDLLAHSLMAVFASMFAWRTWLLVLDSWETGIKSSTYLLTPLWIPQVILSIGFSLLAVTAVLTALAIVAEWTAAGIAGVAGVSPEADPGESRPSSG
jgi:TRAP-type mannitol/chloroaromatic compound transport system permease small subunit